MPHPDPQPAPASATAPAAAVRTLGDKAGIVVASKIVVALAQLAMVLALPRLLPKAEVGVLSFLLLLYQTVSGIAVFGFPQALLYFMPQLTPERRRSLVRLTTTVLGVLGVAGGGVLLAFGGLIAGSFTPSPRAQLPLIALYIALDLPTLALPNLLIAVDRAPLAARLNIITALINVAGLLVPMVLRASLGGILVVFCASAAVRLVIYAAVVAWLHRGVKAAPMRGHLGPLVRFSVPLGISSAIGLLNQQIDKYLIAMSFAATAYADYAMGANELPIVSILPYTVATVLMPTFVEHWKAGRTRELLEVWHASIVKVALVMIPLCVLFFVAAEAYVTLLFTADYLRATGPMRIYLLLLPLRVTSYGVMLQAVGDTRSVLEASVVGVVVNALASAACIAFIGFLGPAVAAVAVQVVMVALMLRRIRSRLRTPLRRLMPWWPAAKIALVAIAVGPIAWVIARAFARQPGLALAAAAVCYFVAYLVVGSAIGVITRADRAWLAARVGLRRRRETTP